MEKHIQKNVKYWHNNNGYCTINVSLKINIQLELKIKKKILELKKV